MEASICSRFFAEGKIIHQHLLRFGNSRANDSVVLDKLTRFRISCNEIYRARYLFDKILTPSINLWNMMIRAYAWCGPQVESVILYNLMLQSGVIPNKYTIPFVLKACSGLHALDDGKKIQAHATISGLISDVFICTALVDMYAKCGSVAEAKRVFRNMSYRDIVAWNSILAGVSSHGLYEHVVKFLVEMQETWVRPNASTIAAALPTIAIDNAPKQGKALHCYVVRNVFYYDVVVSTGIIDMYGKCRLVTYARKLFDRMDFRNEVTWSAMIAAYVSHDFLDDATKLFHSMLLSGVKPNSVTLCCILQACATLNKGEAIHCYTVKSGFIMDVIVGNTILTMYSKCGIIDFAVRLFDELKFKDSVSYNALISGCVQNGDAIRALQIFREMQFLHCKPDLATMSTVLSACSHLADLQHGVLCHNLTIICGFSTDTSICNVLINMYSKCGDVNLARKVFDAMQQRNVVSWNAMILGYGNHGLAVEAISLFHSFLHASLKPDDVTFICLLSALSTTGLVEEGIYWFSAMVEKFHITPRVEHYICMTDLLARAGHLLEVWWFIKSIPIQPGVHFWSTLLSACMMHGNVAMGENILKIIQNLGPQSIGNFVTMSNMYCNAGRWSDSAAVRITQREIGFHKSPGCSMMEINGFLHAFVSGDNSHPKSALIAKKL